MIFSFVTSVLLGATVVPVNADQAATKETDVIVYTEDYPPFNFLDPKSGEVTGFATDSVRNVLDRAGVSYEIRLQPWKRSIRAALTEKNALIYTLTRTPSREKQYNWLLRLAPSRFHIFMRASDKRTPTYQSLKAGEYTASCIKQDITCEFLEAIGIPKENITAVSTGPTGDFRMVMAGRTDIFVSDTVTNKSLREWEGVDTKLVKKSLPINMETGFYLAGNLDLSEEIIQKIENAKRALNLEK
jgi:polar amino acid transport system substrate-binding protein